MVPHLLLPISNYRSGRGRRRGFFTSSLSSLPLGATVAIVVLSIIATTSYFILNRESATLTRSVRPISDACSNCMSNRTNGMPVQNSGLNRKARAQAIVEHRMQKLARLQQTVEQQEAIVIAALDRAKGHRAIDARRILDKEIITGNVKSVITSAHGLRLGTLSGGLPLSRNDQIDQFERSVSAAAITEDTSTLGAFESAPPSNGLLVQMKKLKFAHANATKRHKGLPQCCVNGA